MKGKPGMQLVVRCLSSLFSLVSLHIPRKSNCKAAKNYCNHHQSLLSHYCFRSANAFLPAHRLHPPSLCDNCTAQSRAAGASSSLCKQGGRRCEPLCHPPPPCRHGPPAPLAVHSHRVFASTLARRVAHHARVRVNIALHQRNAVHLPLPLLHLLRYPNQDALTQSVTVTIRHRIPDAQRVLL